MHGRHCLRTWSVTQATVALSSAEAELTALVRASCETIGLCQLASEFGLSFSGRVFADASAALGVVHRRGAGKLRHVRIGSLWVQEAHRAGVLDFHKVAGTDNPADLFTKGLKVEPMRHLMRKLSVEYRVGSAQARLKLMSFLYGSVPRGSIRGGVQDDTVDSSTFRRHFVSSLVHSVDCLPLDARPPRIRDPRA